MIELADLDPTTGPGLRSALGGSLCVVLVASQLVEVSKPSIFPIFRGPILLDGIQ